MNLKKHLPWLGALLPIANTQAETKPKDNKSARTNLNFDIFLHQFII